MDAFPPLPDGEPFDDASAAVMLAMALATMRFEDELGAEQAPDRTRAGGQ